MPRTRSRRAALLAAATVVLALVATATGAKTDVRKPLSETHACTPVGRYCLQSNAWINLHQRLMVEARFDGAPPAALAGDKLETWKQLVARYRRWIGERNPIFDPELVALNATLSKTPTQTLPATVPKEAAAVLEQALPLYLKAQWKADDRGNRFYIALARPMLEHVAPSIIAAHEQAYGVAFPTRILVDVTGLGWQFGAYTVGQGDEAHVVQSHTDPGMQGLAALESLVHEPSHAVVANDHGAIGADITRAQQATKVQPRHNLWHAVLFYTTGELTRRAYARRGIDYVPVITHMYDGPFQGMREPLQTHWQAYLDGKLARDEAMRRVLVETTAAAPKR